MTFIGIDQSLRSSGVCMIDDQGKILITWNLQPPKDLSRDQKIVWQAAEIADRIPFGTGELRVGIESPAFMRVRSQSETALAELSGAIKAYILPLYEIETVHVQSWKSKVARNLLHGQKKSTKAQQAAYLDVCHEITGERFGTTDEADAYMIAEYLRLKTKGII